MFTSDKRYLITGASSGIGKAICCDLITKGASVIGVARSEDKLLALQNELKSEHFHYELCDLSKNLDTIPNMLMKLSKKFGKLSGLVHSAGIQEILPIRSYKKLHLSQLFEINVFSALFLAKGICDKRVNIGKGTSIVFISSIASITGSSGIVGYSASKAALNGMMRSLAVEMAPQGIRVNSILPGFVMTEMIENWKQIYNDEYIKEIDEKYPLGIGKPEDVAEPVSFLLSEQAKWITGIELCVDGGGHL
ncbi:hypothetical protein PN36_17480 [Candidatus Thiomargarita nelsonii]|uniref:3-oxoacyl-ACP reductase n=1 Tax=Candidatus Thiomargarita nelsonii TaxID=1003181 RepID=A0A4E0QNE9_9GAMM|nr:hypothetical protein PN36_17480 [Candidatus Thiomargarita nelsonii]